MLWFYYQCLLAPNMRYWHLTTEKKVKTSYILRKWPFRILGLFSIHFQCMLLKRISRFSTSKMFTWLIFQELRLDLLFQSVTLWIAWPFNAHNVKTLKFIKIPHLMFPLSSPLHKNCIVHCITSGGNFYHIRFALVLY